MDSVDLASLRKRFQEHGILLCFNGPISRSLIEEIGEALRNHLNAERAHQSEAMDVFATYIEMTQNIRHYATQKGYGEVEAGATVVVARRSANYVVSAGNIIEMADGRVLVERIAALALLDKAALKAAYKEQLRKSRDPAKASGAGLGLIDMARRASVPLAATLNEQSDGRGFFTLSAVI